MQIYDYMEKYGYEQLVHFHDKNTGLKAIVCIHNTACGPALGGTRFWNYNTEDEAVEDALRLAKGMTYKNAAAGLNLGGGKAVIIGDAKAIRKDIVKREAFWRAYGRFVQGLNGRYITAEDVNTTPADMNYISMETNYVAGLAKKSGDPSPFTATGVYYSTKACAKEVYGNDSLEGKTIAVQGLGHVGYYLCKHYHEEGANLIVTDIDKDNLERVVNDFGAKAVDPNDIYSVDAQIYSPCALGAVINDDTIPQFKFKIISGAANNVLKDQEIHGKAIVEKGIVYSPDYIANAGGVINVFQEIIGYDVNESNQKVKQIYDRVREIIRKSNETNLPTYVLADKMAEDRIDAIAKMKGIFNV